MDYHVKILAAVAIIEILLSFFVLKQERSRINILFSLFTLLVGLWSFGVGVFIYTRNLDLALFVMNFFYLAPPLIVTVFFYFSLIFLGKKIEKKHYLLLIPFAGLLIIFSLNPNLFLSAVYSVDYGLYKDVIINKNSHILYAIYVMGSIAASYILLFKAKYRVFDSNYKRQLNVVIAGTLISYLLAAIFNLLLPFLGNYQLVFLGPLSTLIMVFSIAYAVVKYHLFNIRLIIVEIALIVLSFILLANIFVSQGASLYILNTALFVGVGILSIFLIRGIYKDIRDREQIEKLVKEMEQANQRLLALEQQKTEFVSIASHQLRTPMTVIKGYASMVLEGAFGVLPPQAKEAMGNLYKSSERIVALIEDLLTVSRIEQGRGLPVFQTINFTDFIRELLLPYTASARAAGLKMAFTTTPGSEGASVALDRKKFEQALRHIIDNAIKYTKAPGSIGVAISNDATNHKVFLSVSDTGIGMTEEQIKSLSEKGGEGDGAWGSFFGFAIPVPKEKDGAPTAKTRGIGFYIAQELITAHYGSVRVESEGPGRGTTVVIELPEMREGDNQ